MPPPADQQRCVPRRDVTPYLGFGGKGVKRSDKRRACAASEALRFSPLLLRDHHSKRSLPELGSEPRSVFIDAFYPTSAGQKSAEPRPHFRVLLRCVLRRYAASLCSLEFGPLIVILEENVGAWGGWKLYRSPTCAD